MPIERDETIPRKWGRYGLLAALLLALLVQVVVVLRSPAIARDGVTFITLARELWDSPLATMRQADQHPGYPAMVLLGHGVLNLFVDSQTATSWVWAARTVTGLFGLLSVVAMWLLGRRLFDARVAAVSAVLFAAAPLFRQNACDALSDTPHLFFYLMAVWLVCEGLVRKRWPWLAAGGAASGVAYWIRPEGLGVALVATVIVVGFRLWRRPGWKVIDTARCAVAVALAASAVCMPYILIKGKPTAKKDFAEVVHPETWELQTVPVAPRPGPTPAPAPAIAPEQDSVFYHAAVRLARAAYLLLGEIAYGLRFIMLVPLLMGFVGAGRLRAQTASRTFVGVLTLLNLVLLLTLYVVAGYIDHRHVMMVVSLMMPWVASGTLYLPDRLNLRAGRATATGPDWKVAVVLAILLVACLPRSFRQTHQNRLPYLRAASWIQSQREKEETVFSNSSYLLFFANSRDPVLAPDSIIPEVRSPDGGRPDRFVVLDTTCTGYSRDWIARIKGQGEIVAIPDVSAYTERIVALVLRNHSRDKDLGASERPPVGEDH